MKKAQITEKRTKAKPYPFGDAYRKELAAALRTGRSLLKEEKSLAALRFAFGQGWGAARDYEQAHRNQMHEKMKAVDLTRHPQIKALREKEKRGLYRTPSDDLILQTAKRVQSWKAPHVRGVQIREEAKRNREAWLPAAKKQFEVQRRKHPTWGKPHLAKIVAGKRYKTLLRHL